MIHVVVRKKTFLLKIKLNFKNVKNYICYPLEILDLKKKKKNRSTFLPALVMHLISHLIAK